MLYDVDADPAERHDLAGSPAHRQVLGHLLERLAFYNASNVPCCICTGSGRTGEMDEPPLEGYWTSFRDQGPNPDPSCALQNEPPAARRGDGGGDELGHGRAPLQSRQAPPSLSADTATVEYRVE